MLGFYERRPCDHRHEEFKSHNGSAVAGTGWKGARPKRRGEADMVGCGTPDATTRRGRNMRRWPSTKPNILRPNEPNGTPTALHEIQLETLPAGEEGKYSLETKNLPPGAVPPLPQDYWSNQRAPGEGTPEHALFMFAVEEWILRVVRKHDGIAESERFLKGVTD
jgi:hypothetical protein